MTVCVGFLTSLGLAFVLAILPLAIVPALGAWWASRREGAWRFLPLLLYGAAGTYAGLESTMLDRPWMPTVYVVTALVWLPRSSRPFSAGGRAWLSYAASFAALTTVMNDAFRANAFYCGLV